MGPALVHLRAAKVGNVINLMRRAQEGEFSFNLWDKRARSLPGEWLLVNLQKSLFIISLTHQELHYFAKYMPKK